MTIPRGRIGTAKTIASVRAITREDLPRLMGPRDKSSSVPQRLRESHHSVARFLAMGHSYKLVAELTGYSYNRIHQLAVTPAMIELVAHYRSRISEIWEDNIDAYTKVKVNNMLSSERHIADRIAELDEVGELLPIREALAISADGADRFGYSKKQTNININGDIADQLEKAIARSAKVIDNVIPIRPLAGPETAPVETHRTLPSLPTPAPVPTQPSLKRRA